MIPRLQNYIKDRQEKGVSNEKIKSDLLKIGWLAADIDQYIQSPEPEIPLPLPPVPTHFSTLPKTSPQNSAKSGLLHTNLEASQLLLILGITLVLVATAVVIIFSWANLLPVNKFLVIAVPNLILFLTGFFVKKQLELVHVEDGTTAAGLVMLPATIGTFLFQFELYSKVDNGLFFFSTLIALPVFLYFDLYRQKAFAASLTLTNILAIVLFFGAYRTWELTYWTLTGLFLGFICLGVAVVAEKYQDKHHRRNYTVVSGFLFLVTIPTLVADSLGLLNDSGESTITYITYQKQLVLYLLLSGITGLLISSLYGWVFRNKTQTEVGVQRILQLGALLSLLIPLINLISINNLFIILALVVSILVALLGLLVGVRLIFLAGIVSFVINLLVFIFSQVQNSITTPILIFILGFMAIGISILFGKLKLEGKMFYSANIARFIGVMSDEESSHISTPARTPRSWLTIIGFILGIWILVGYLVPRVLFNNNYRGYSPGYSTYPTTSDFSASDTPTINRTFCENTCTLGELSFTLPKGWGIDYNFQEPELANSATITTVTSLNESNMTNRIEVQKTPIINAGLPEDIIKGGKPYLEFSDEAQSFSTDSKIPAWIYTETENIPDVQTLKRISIILIVENKTVYYLNLWNYGDKTLPEQFLNMVRTVKKISK